MQTYAPTTCAQLAKRRGSGDSLACLGAALDLTYRSREGARLAEVLFGRAFVEAVALDAQPHEVQVDRRGGDEGRRFKRCVLACAEEREARSLLSACHP